MKDYPMPDMATCQSKAKAIHSKIKVGKASTVCWKV